MSEGTPTHCFVCNEIMHNRISCSKCESLVCCEVCLVAHNNLMHPMIQTVTKKVKAAGVAVQQGLQAFFIAYIIVAGGGLLLFVLGWLIGLIT